MLNWVYFKAFSTAIAYSEKTSKEIATFVSFLFPFVEYVVNMRFLKNERYLEFQRPWKLRKIAIFLTWFKGLWGTFKKYFSRAKNTSKMNDNELHKDQEFVVCFTLSHYIILTLV